MAGAGWKRPAAVLLLLLFGLAVLAGCGGQGTKGETGDTAFAAEQRKQVERLNSAADDMYRHAMEGDLEKARIKLEEVGAVVTAIRFDGIASVEAINALTESIVHAKRIFVAVKYSPDEGQAAAAAIRLATDALTHANQPMWLQYYAAMQDAVDRLEGSLQNKQAQRETTLAFNELQVRYRTIRPSVLISRPIQATEQVESLLTFVGGELSRGEPDAGKLGGALSQLRLAFDGMFERNDRSAFVPMVRRTVPLTWVALFGSIIVSVLAFAAWRIFDFERNKFGGSRFG